MFEYEGQQYSLEEVQKAAEQSGLSVEDYVANAGLKPLEEGKQEGVVEGETTEAQDQKPVTESSSEDGSSELQAFDPSKLGPMVQEEETYMGVSRKPMLVPDTADYEEMRKAAIDEFNGRKAGQKLRNTPVGPVLPYDDDKLIKEFNNETLNALVTKDQKIQGLISQTLDEKKDEIQEGLNNIMSEYEGMDIEDLSPQDIKKVQEKYSTLINQLAFANPDVQKRIDTYEGLIGDAHKKDYDDYVVDDTILDVMNRSTFDGVLRAAYQNMPTFVRGGYKTIHGIGTSIKAGGLSQAEYLKVQEQHERNVKRAEEEGWDENTVGFFNSKGAFVVPKQGGYHPSTYGFTQKGKWGDAKNLAEEKIKDGKENQAEDLKLIFERQALESHFGHADVRDVLRSGKSWNTIKTIAAEQLPQMASAILSFGTLPAAQMAGDNYLRQVQSIAKERYNTLQPSIEQLMKVVEDDVDDDIFNSAVAVGAYGGAAEYVGATSVLGKSLGMNLLGSEARKNTAALMKGQFKAWGQQQLKRTGTSFRGGFDEMMTEVFQQAASDVTVGEYIKENYIQGGGAGFVMGFLMPFGSNVAASTAKEVSTAYSIASGKLDLKGMKQFHQYNLGRLDQDLKIGQITQEQYDSKKQQLEDFMMSSQRFDRTMSADQKASLMDAVYEKNEAEQKLKKFQDSEEGQRIKELERIRKEETQVLNQELKDGIITEEQHASQMRVLDSKYRTVESMNQLSELKNDVIQKTIDLVDNIDYNNNLNNTIKAFANLDIVGENIVVAGTSREYAAAVLKDRGITNPTKEELDYAEQELAKKPGVFTSNNKIILNSEGSIATGNITTASHEVFHAVLYNTFTAMKEGKAVVNEQALTQTIGALNEYLVQLEDSGKIKNLDAWRARLRSYQTFELLGKKYNADELYAKAGRNMQEFNRLASLSEVSFETKNLEEFMTTMSDALLNGTVQYDTSFFEAMGDFIRRLLQAVGLKSVEFNTGKDVFNFIRDYNNSVIKGKSNKAQRRFAEYGGKGVLLQIDPNSIGSKAAEDMNSVSDMDGKKSGPTKAQQEMSAEVQRLWEEQGVGSVYDIAEMYRPMFRKVVIRGGWDALPGWSQYADIIEDEALLDMDGLVGIVMSYKDDKGVPLAAYINKYFALRAANIKNKYLGKTFDKNVDDLKGGGPAVSQEQEIEDAIDKPSGQGEFSRIRRKLGLDPQEMNIVRAVVTRTLSLSPDLLSTKKWKPSLFRAYLLEAYKTQIYKTVLEKFPTRSTRFQEWAMKNKGWIQEEISLNTLRKFPALNGVLYEFQKDANGKVMRYNTEESIRLGIKDVYSGVNKIQRRFPTQEEWANYLDPTRIGRSRNMPHEHKRVLAEAIAMELGLDATLEVMQNPNQQQYDLEGNPIEGREVNMYERMIEKNADVVEENQVIGRVAYLLERDPLMKFSQNALDAGMGGLRMAELILENPGPLLDAFKQTIAPYRLIPMMKRDNTLGQLRIAMSNSLVNAFKQHYPWLNEQSASVLARQLAVDFANIARSVDTIKLQVHEAAEKEFTDSLADNLFNIAQNTVLNEGHEAIIPENKSVPPFLTKGVLGKVFTTDRSNSRIIPWVTGEHSNELFKSPFYTENGVFDTGAYAYTPQQLQGDIAQALLKTKYLYENGNLSRDEVRLIFDKIFNDSNGRKALINFAAPVGMRMVGLQTNNTQSIFSIPPKYLSGYLANAVLNPRKKGKDLLTVLGDFMTIQVTKKYADKIVKKQGVGMPHFRNNVEPTFLSRISRVSVGKEGTSSTFEIYRTNLLQDSMNINAEGDVVFDTGSGTAQAERTQDATAFRPKEAIALLDHKSLVGLDYNMTVAKNIQSLMDDIGKFSVSSDGKGKGKGKKRTLKDLDSDLQDILEELQNNGTLNQDPEKMAQIEEEERLNQKAADLDAEFNSILEQVTGVDAGTEFSEVAARQIGKGKNERVFFVPPSHDDYKGLIENYLVGKGADAKKHISFFEEYLFEPYYEGVNNYSSERVRMMRQYRDVKKTFKPLFKDLKSEAFPGMSVENAIRVYIWSRKGYEIPGISTDEIQKAQSFVVKNGLAREVALEIMKITDLHGHVTPGKHWNGGGIVGDIIDSLKKNSRAKYLEEWNQNVDFIFNEKNMNKLRAAFGNEYVESLQNIIKRMKSGRNRLETGDSKYTNQIMDWLNGSVGVVMFANTRSAMLQLISFTNYIEAAGPNNVLKAGAAYANQKQFWSDVMKLINSDYMRERREGLKIDINEAELADSTKNATNKFKAAVSWLLSKGFMPTQIADSLAIVMGGAPYYRNYVNQYMEQGLSQEEAEARAFIDFRNKTEESQQSSRPDRISSQQASLGGRLLLTFANTQSQYDRIIKKELNNLKNKRGNAANSMARIAYYGMAQHALFVSLQSALIGMLLGFSDDDDEGTINSSQFKLINGMLDSILRGAGIRGHIVSVMKNVGVEFIDRTGRPNPDYEMLAFEAANLAPALGSKLNKMKSTGYYLGKSKDTMGTIDMLSDTNFLKALAVGTSVSTNIPLDRLLQKYENVMNAIDLEGEFKTYEQILMGLGWPDYQIGVEKKEFRKKSRTKSRKVTRSRRRR